LTRRLYYDDSYRLEFAARLIEVVPQEEGGAGLILDETLFYPTSGGQLHDHGTLGGLAIIDVIEDGGRILHLVEGATPVVGSELTGIIDADRRMHHRQQHTGQHVLSRVIEDQYGWPTLSSRLGETMNTLEIAATELPVDLLDEIEDRTNRTIWKGHPVHVHYLDDAEAGGEGLRGKVGREGPLRVIDVEGVDRCACGGTHVRNTAEIGLVAIAGSEKVRGGMRLHFVCGERAVRWRRERVHWLDRTARQLTTGQDLVADTVQRLQEENRERKKRLESVARELVEARVPVWRAGAERIGTVLAVLRVLDDDESLAASEAIHATVNDAPLLAVFVVRDGPKRQVFVARGVDVSVDCGRLLHDVLGQFDGRGGGKSEFARGGCGDVEPGRLLEAVRELLGSDSDDPG
jgi:alanyl-tRNA synthetase